jgi:hypothetical protein
VFATADPHYRDGLFYHCGQPILHLCLSSSIPPNCVSKICISQMLGFCRPSSARGRFFRLLTRFSTLNCADCLSYQGLAPFPETKSCSLLQTLVRRVECGFLSRYSAEAFAVSLSCYFLSFRLLVLRRFQRLHSADPSLEGEGRLTMEPGPLSPPHF